MNTQRFNHIIIEKRKSSEKPDSVFLRGSFSSKRRAHASFDELTTKEQERLQAFYGILPLRESYTNKTIITVPGHSTTFLLLKTTQDLVSTEQIL